MTALKWAVVCGMLNAAGVAVVALAALLTDLSGPVSLLIGALFVAASAVPFGRAQKAYAAENAAGTASI